MIDVEAVSDLDLQMLGRLPTPGEGEHVQRGSMMRLTRGP